MPARPTYSPMTPHDGTGGASNPNLYSGDNLVSALLEDDVFGEFLRGTSSNFVFSFSVCPFARLLMLGSLGVLDCSRPALPML